MNVFVLCTGRCGSMTFAKACSHIRNYTSGHETRTQFVGEERLQYPDRHIEADNRLSWFLGRLDQEYGIQAYYVHLVRDKNDTARSFNKRWDNDFSIISAYNSGILMRGLGDYEICLDYWDTVNANIRMFLKDKHMKCIVELENYESGFRKFWEDIGAVGDLSAALHEWTFRTNISTDKEIEEGSSGYS